MRCTGLRWSAIEANSKRRSAIRFGRKAFFALALTCLLAATGLAAERPQYGGVLRVELRATSVTLQPARWKAGSGEFAANERLAELVFDRLVTLDNYGRFQPQLATEWSHDGAAKKWQFTLRQGVKFSDGTALTPSDVLTSLRALLPHGIEAAASAAGVTIQCARPANDMLEMLASGPYFVYKDNGSGQLLGTGPFVLESITATAREPASGGGDGAPGQTQRLRFKFNDLCWSGRPYVDGVEVALGVPPVRALLDVQLGKADLGELSVDTVRRADQSNLKSWKSAPLTLYALKFQAAAKTENDQLVREAIGLSVDREAMARVLLQKQAEPSGSFLPQWLSGYAFLFAGESNVERAKELRAKLAGNLPGVTLPLRISVDLNSELSKLVAERIAVNARAAGLLLQTTKGTARLVSEGEQKTDGEAQVIAWRYTTLSPRGSLEALALAQRWALPEGGVPEGPEARYAWEKHMMEEKKLVPIVAVPDFAAAGGRVRNWSPAPWGEWRLADVWLERGETNERQEAGSKSAAGAKP